MTGVSVPKKITCHDQVFALDFHPNRPYLAAGLITGSIELWNYDIEGSNSLALNLTHHQHSCTGLLFNSTGENLVSTSSDRSWKVVTESGTIALEKTDAHIAAINRMLLMDEHLLATGDDNGIVKIWDMRTAQETMTWDVHTDFVTQLLYQGDSHTLFSTSGDATLGVYDIRQAKKFYKSDDQESELCCMELMRGGKKLVCGSQGGVLLFFNHGAWGDCSDRYPGHPESIDCMYKVDETALLTGSSDGLVRVLGVQPNKILGVIGNQADVPVEIIKADHNKKFIGTLAYDEVVRFWDISILQDDEDEEGEEEEAAGGDDGSSRSAEEEQLAGESHGSNSDSEDQLAEAASEEDDGDAETASNSDEHVSGSDGEAESKADSSDDSDDSSVAKPSAKKMKRLPTNREKFYSDL